MGPPTASPHRRTPFVSAGKPMRLASANQPPDALSQHGNMHHLACSECFCTLHPGCQAAREGCLI
jgi:hypothetical protein